MRKLKISDRDASILKSKLGTTELNDNNFSNHVKNLRLITWKMRRKSPHGYDV